MMKWIEAGMGGEPRTDTERVDGMDLVDEVDVGIE